MADEETPYVIVDEAFRQFGWFLDEDTILDTIKKIDFNTEPGFNEFWYKKVPEIIYNSEVYKEDDGDYYLPISEVIKSFMYSYRAEWQRPPDIEEKEWYKEKMSKFRCRHRLEVYYPCGKDNYKDCIKEEYEKRGWNISEEMIDHINEYTNMFPIDSRDMHSQVEKTAIIIERIGICPKPDGLDKETFNNIADYSRDTVVYIMDLCETDKDYEELMDEIVDSYLLEAGENIKG